MRVEGERAQRAAEARELRVELLRMRPARLEQVAERGEARMNRMREPETRHVAGRIRREIRLGSPTLTHERVALRVEDLDHAPNRSMSPALAPISNTGGMKSKS